MGLTRKERLLLWNQYSILEILKPDAEHYQKLKTILERGYCLHYNDLWPHIDEGDFPEEAAREVISILEMFEVIQDSLANAEGFDDCMLHFAGFDANNELAQLEYLRFLVDRQERFQHVVKLSDYNSHVPLLDSYREMLARYIELGRPKQMRGDQIKSVASGL
jgi:uncharacterized protein